MTYSFRSDNIGHNVHEYNDKIWITWERQRRSLVLAEQFNSKLFVLDDIFRNDLFRYLILSFSTLKLLFNAKPKYVFCQNPSIILACLLCLVKSVFGYVLIVDRHSNFRFGKQKNIVDYIFHLLSNYTIRNANITLVTNNYLCELVSQKGGTGAILEDKLPDLKLGKPIELKGIINVVFVSSFSRDEPVDEVIYSFEGFDDYCLYITGNYKKHTKYTELAKTLPDNIIFTGFLEEYEYQSLLTSVDIVMVLTTHDHTLTCGAYEGVALEKPLILSDTYAIRKYFRRGVVYTKADRIDIRKSIIRCVAELDGLKKEINLLHSELNADWQTRFTKIKKRIFC